MLTWAISRGLQMVDERARFIRGSGRAHRHCEQYHAIFGHPMTGTFNVETALRLSDCTPARVVDDKQFYLAKVNDRYGWAVRWDGSRQRKDRFEIISKEPFLDSFTDGELRLEILERWSDDQIGEWAEDMDWFQSFPWGPQRADSAMVWDVIKDRVDWRGKSVLDIGCNFGYYAFQAAKAGARVQGIDKNENVIRTARTINDRIEMLDVRFDTGIVQSIGSERYDVIFYFSVHHQFDRSYVKLREYVARIWNASREKLFIELIVPSMDGSMDENTIDLTVDGEMLLKYKHKVRGIRKLYEVKRG